MDEDFIKKMLKFHTVCAWADFGEDVVVVLNEGEPGEYEDNPTVRKYVEMGYKLCDANMFGHGDNTYESLTFRKVK